MKPIKKTEKIKEAIKITLKERTLKPKTIKLKEPLLPIDFTLWNERPLHQLSKEKEQDFIKYLEEWQENKE